MMLKIVNILIFVCSGVVVSTYTTEDRASCCPLDQIFLRSKRGHGNHSCWDVTDNSTREIPFSCHGKRMQVITARDHFFVTENGQLEIVLKNRDNIVYEPKTFCVGHTLSSRLAVLCIEYPETRIIDEDLNGYLMFISAGFLALTAIIYAVRRDLIKDVQGISTFNLCMCLAISQGILAGMKLIPYSDMNLCAIRGVVAYFFSMAGFFWMNALSLQILLNLRYQHEKTTTNYGERGFFWYGLYAWCCPSVLTFILVLINFTPGDHIKPGIGLNHCWFFDTKQQWQYMYGAMSVLIAMNIFMFIYSTILLWRQETETTMLNKFLMTLRLFVLMGVLWVFEPISSVAPHHLAWEVTDLINSLQGVYMFLALIVLLPFSKMEINKTAGVQYNMNITTNQPYSKFVS